MEGEERRIWEDTIRYGMEGPRSLARESDGMVYHVDKSWQAGVFLEYFFCIYLFWEDLSRIGRSLFRRAGYVSSIGQSFMAAFSFPLDTTNK